MTDAQVAVALFGLLVAAGSAGLTVADYWDRTGGALGLRWLAVAGQIAILGVGTVAAVTAHPTSWTATALEYVVPAYLVGVVISIVARPPTSRPLPRSVVAVALFLAYCLVVVRLLVLWFGG